MNRNVLWTIFAIGFYWLTVAAIGNDWTRNIVAGAGIVIALATFLRYLPNAWDKYRNDHVAGEWRMLMGIELFWFLFGTREAWLLGGRLGHWSTADSPIAGFFAFGFLCAGLLCYSAASEPVPTLPHQNGYIIAAAALVGALCGMLAYRFIWG